MTDTPKRFDEWEEVECNECGRYWTDQCDGVSKGSTKRCNSFLATRSIVIPARLKSLENNLKSLRFGVILHYILFIVYLILRFMELV